MIFTKENIDDIFTDSYYLVGKNKRAVLTSVNATGKVNRSSIKLLKRIWW